MKRIVYEAPRTVCFQVELEGTLMSASIVENQNSSVQTTGHELNEVDVSAHDWNDAGVETWQ